MLAFKLAIFDQCQCILLCVRILLAKDTPFSTTSETLSYRWSRAVLVKGIKGTTELASSLIQVFSDLHVTDQVNCHPTPRIALSVRPFVCPTLKNPASEIHASGSRIMDTSIIHTCITHACIRIKEHRYMHHTYLHQGQGSRIVDTCNIHMCIMHTCTRIKNPRDMHHEYMHHRYMHYEYMHQGNIHAS